MEHEIWPFALTSILTKQIGNRRTRTTKETTITINQSINGCLFPQRNMEIKNPANNLGLLGVGRNQLIKPVHQQQLEPLNSTRSSIKGYFSCVDVIEKENWKIGSESRNLIFLGLMGGAFGFFLFTTFTSVIWFCLVFRSDIRWQKF